MSSADADDATATLHPVLPEEVVHIVTEFLDLATATRCCRINSAWDDLCALGEPIVVNNEHEAEAAVKEFKEEQEPGDSQRCELELRGYCVELPFPRKGPITPADYKNFAVERTATGVITAATLHVVSELPIAALTLHNSMMSDNDPAPQWRSKKVPFADDRPASVDDWVAFLRQPLPHLQKLTLHNSDLLTLRHVALQSLGAQLLSLTLAQEVTSAAAALAIQWCPHLKNLEVDRFWSSAFSGCSEDNEPQWADDDDDGDSDEDAGQKLPKLLQLRSFVCPRDSSLTDHVIAVAAPNLIHVDTQNIWPFVAAAQSVTLPLLRSLSCGQAPNAEQLNVLLRTSPLLESLTFNGSSKLTMQALDAEGISALQHLRVLHLGHNTAVTMEGLRKMRQLAPNLERLKLPSSFKGDKSAVSALFVGCHEVLFK